MYQQPYGLLSRKRGRDSDDETGPQGFKEHRAKKRHLASLPLRRSPEQNKRFLPTFHTNHHSSQSPTFADITPVGSDSEDVPPPYEPKSCFSPWSSPLGQSLMESSQSSPYPGSSQSTEMPDSQAYSDDLEMTDMALLYPGYFQSDPSSSIANRIPTPIHCRFSSHIRSVGKAPYLNNSMNAPENDADEEAIAGRNGGGHRLPSPISEDETSPSSLLQELADVQMEMEHVMEEQKPTPKKGYTRSKHNLRNWGGFGSDIGGVGLRRGFSMGYRSDCEKCRMKVPGHFSHIITY